ncbi:hypothetical protein F8M41_014130 [Gigaspora margarita]|uniref:Uncharacterized protein n=1 Tax=Gigaspora margarita TaxID=4874 RepID=A0A8H4ARS8_GIGMA|nr:hypothetical protein F8M41_014130 [Gigaspora margarita]
MAHINYTNSLQKTTKLSQNSPFPTSRSQDIPKKLLSWSTNENKIHYKNTVLLPTESPQNTRLTHFLHKNYHVPDRPKSNNDIYNNQPSLTFTDISNGQSLPTPINGIYNNQPLSNIHKKRLHKTLINDIKNELHDAEGQLTQLIPTKSPSDDNSNAKPTLINKHKAQMQHVPTSTSEPKSSHDDKSKPKSSHDDKSKSKPSHDDTKPSHNDTKPSHDDMSNTPNFYHTLADKTSSQTQPSPTQVVQPNSGTQNPNPVKPGFVGNTAPTQSQSSQPTSFQYPTSIDEASKNPSNITPSLTDTNSPIQTLDDDGIKYEFPSTTAGPKQAPNANVAPPQIIKSPNSIPNYQPYQPYKPLNIPSISPTSNSTNTLPLSNNPPAIIGIIIASIIAIIVVILIIKKTTFGKINIEPFVKRQFKIQNDDIKVLTFNTSNSSNNNQNNNNNNNNLRFGNNFGIGQEIDGMNDPLFDRRDLDMIELQQESSSNFSENSKFYNILKRKFLNIFGWKNSNNLNSLSNMINVDNVKISEKGKNRVIYTEEGIGDSGFGVSSMSETETTIPDTLPYDLDWEDYIL